MTVLVIAPHPDDEVLGCGGVIAKRAKNGDDVWVCIVTEGKEPLYSKKFARNERQEMKAAHKILGVSHLIMLGFPSAELDKIPQREINDVVSGAVEMVCPDEVFIPHRGDVHRDHQIVADAAMVALRPRGSNSAKRVLSYETLSETDWNTPDAGNAFIPNVYEDISNTIQTKITAMNCYGSQLKEFPDPRSIIGLKSLAIHRGVVSGLGYAEAFMMIREVHK